MWPTISYETYPWERTPEEFDLIPRSRRRAITSTYEAAVPPAIAKADAVLPASLLLRLAELRATIARFDQEQNARDYRLPALLLRSESSSSSQIEQLTSSARSVALAELSQKAPSNAQLIANNVAAMREALGESDARQDASGQAGSCERGSRQGTLSWPASVVTVDLICRIHDTIMRNAPADQGFRTEQVWIGGTFYSPHGAKFVPPHASRLDGCLEDLVQFAARSDIDPIAKAAIFHAQFEAIHPFTDGNGRTGRALLHRTLANDEVLLQTMLPVSAGLLHNIDDYMGALNAYHEGEIEPMVICLADALELSIALGRRITADVDEVLAGWREVITVRKGSASHRLPALLVEQPVVDTKYVAQGLGITDRAARSLVDDACERGILAKMGNAQRGAFYQAPALLEILEEASNSDGIRRMLQR